MFSSGYRKFFLLLFLFAFALMAGSYVRSHWPLPASSNRSIAGAWSVEKSGSGLAVSWNFDAPPFRGVRNATLEIEDGNERRKINLKREDQANTLFYTPRQPDVTLRLRIPAAGAEEAEKTEVIRIGSPRPEVAAQPQAERTEAAPEESTRSRTVTPVSMWRVRAFAPVSLTNHLKEAGMEVAVYVKIEPSGKVREASTRRYEDSTEAALAKIATAAARQWKFDPLKGSSRANPIYRDFVIHFKFPKT